MNKLKFTGLFSFLIATTFFIVSCEQDNDEAPRYSYLNRTLSASQVVGPTTATSSGKLEGTYDSETHTLTYRVTLRGLTKPLTGTTAAIHIHAFADSGYTAIPTPNFANGIAQIFTSGWVVDSTSTTPPPPPNSYILNGTLFVDGLVIKEEDLLAGKYYIDVHNADFPAPPTTNPLGRGEIRGQLKFN